MITAEDSAEVFFVEEILTCHCRKSTGVNNEMNDG